MPDKCVTCKRVVIPGKAVAVYRGKEMQGWACNRACAQQVFTKSTPGTTPPDAGVDRTQGTFGEMRP